ncbi:hypothetical protein R6U77_01830 [Lysinibacillus louembei]|uniref:Uncharacterized protein n=1 Tax=Lysinibacillus louembei TaxID=1470088 RepID=A0ABZ0RZU5_9BACI|nr:hypothetical protein [Lysinibacillus louembei]WPK12458.1 hypothetical protein R6U77_01830 [Lysinibacillus louembei]
MEYLLVLLLVMLICNFIVQTLIYIGKNSVGGFQKFKISQDFKSMLKYFIWMIILSVLVRIYPTKLEKMSSFGEINYLIWAILIYFFITISIIFALSVVTIIYNFLLRMMYKRPAIYDKELAIWLSKPSITYDFFFAHFSELAEVNDIKNLKKVKHKIQELCEDNLFYYELLRNHLKFKIKNNPSNKLKVLLFPIVTLSITPFVIKILNNRIESIGNYFSGANPGNNEQFNKIMDFVNAVLKIENIPLFAMVLAIVLVIWIIAKFSINFFTIEKRTLKYFLSILDLIIEEKKQQESSSFDLNKM